MSELVCRQIYVKGHVQGVGFRKAVLDQAQKIGGLLGWVRNLANGDVEIVVGGTEKGVAALIRWCHEDAGKLTRVDMIDERKVRLPESLKPFSIRRT